MVGVVRGIGSDLSPRSPALNVEGALTSRKGKKPPPTGQFLPIASPLPSRRARQPPK